MNATANLVQARAARPEDVEPMLGVLCGAFGIDRDAARPLFYQDPFFDFSHKRILVTPEDGLVSCLTVIPSTMLIGGTTIPVGGIAGVATHQAHQRRGHAGRLLSATIGALADELSYPVSALFPYSYDYYGKFGWATASRAVRWYGEAASLPAGGDSGRVRPVQPEIDAVTIHRLHEAAVRDRTGAFRRDGRRWKIIEELTPARVAVVYEGYQGAIEGYLCFEAQTTADETTVAVHEIYGTTREARRALIAFLARYGDGSAQIEWESSPEDLQHFGVFSLPFRNDCRPRMTLQPGMMLRLNDLPAALSRLHGTHYAPVLDKTDGTLTIRASDPIRRRNERPVRLLRSGVYPGALTDRDWIAADISVLAQLFIGYQTPAEAAALGVLRASSPETLALADRLFPARQPFVSPLDQF